MKTHLDAHIIGSVMEGGTPIASDTCMVWRGQGLTTELTAAVPYRYILIHLRYIVSDFSNCNMKHKHFVLPDDNWSKLVEKLRPIKNSFHGSKVHINPIKARVVVPADFLPSAQIVVKKQDSSFQS